MPAILLASVCPAPVVESSYPLLSTSENTAGTGINVARSFAAGDTSTVPSKLNRNANALDAVVNFGGGGFAIATGLALSAGSGLNVSIAAGLAMCGGAVELAASTLAVPANHTGSPASDRVWVWLQQNGTPTYTLSTTPPAARCVLLGSVTTDASSVTSVDTSGVMYLKGGALFRETADAGAPGDSPSPTLTFLAKTWGGLYAWTGTAYQAVYSLMSTNRKTIGSGEAGAIGDGEQAIVYGSMTITGTGSLTISSTGELIVV